MTKTIFKTLLSLLILFSISCGDRPTGSDGGGIIGDNKETPQTETQASKDFLKSFNSLAPQYTGKIEEVYDIEYNRKEYIFDNSANITVNYTDYYGQPQKDTATFWGMAPDNPELAYYYMESGEGQKSYLPYNYALAFKNGTIAEESAYPDSELNKKMQAAMLEVDTSGKTYYDHSKINPTQTTSDAANNWKSQVANKTFNSKSMTTYNYTFELGGNIKETTGKGGQYERTKTYHFWGALDNNRVVYYKIDSINGKDYWAYCGFSFDIADTANQKISKYDEYSAAYYNSLSSWGQNNLDSEGNLKPNGSWGTYPLPTTKDIDWSKPTTGTLTTK